MQSQIDLSFYLRSRWERGLIRRTKRIKKKKKKIRWHWITTYQDGIENTHDAYNASDQVYVDVTHYNQSTSILMEVG